MPETAVPRIPPKAVAHEATIQSFNGEGRILELEGLRGACALSVLVAHLFGSEWLKRSIERPLISGFWQEMLTSAGVPAVLVFFLLSGFVIGWTNAVPWSASAAIQYAKRRFIRIEPIYLVAMILSTAVASWQSQPIEWKAALGGLVFLQDGVVDNLAMNPPLWSLHYEVIYYALFPVAWRLGPVGRRRLFFIGVICAILSFFFPLRLLRVLGLLPYWLAGCEFALRPGRWSVSNSGRDPRSLFWTAVFLLLASYNFKTINSIAGHFDFNRETALGLLIDLPLYAQVIACVLGMELRWWGKLCIPSIAFSVVGLLYSTVVNPQLMASQPPYQAGAAFLGLALISQLLRLVAPIAGFRKLAPVGTISYGLYVIHWPICEMVMNKAGKIATTGGTLLVTLVAGALSVLVAILLEKILQPRVAAKLRGLLGVRAPEIRSTEEARA